MDSMGIAGTSGGFRSLVLEQNLLAKASEAGRRKLWKEMSSRYTLDATDPLFAAFLLEWARCQSEEERALTAYILFALNDKLVSDLGVQWLFPLLRRAPAELRVPDVLAFMGALGRSHPELGNWTENTKRSWAQDYCASVRDFGLAKGVLRKATVHPALYGPPVRLLVRALALAGVRVKDLIVSPMFRLLCMDQGEVVDALGELNRRGELRFKIQGDVIELDLGDEA
jgi:hypothetical protein